MERKIDQLLNEYGESHQNKLNKLIHWVCVPLIMFSLFGLLMSIPVPFEPTLFGNIAGAALIAALVYYLRLSIPMFLGFIVIGFLMLEGNFAIWKSIDFNSGRLALISVFIFVLAWLGQFYGHHIEGKKPSFAKDLQFLLIGPAWLLHFVFRKLKVKY